MKKKADKVLIIKVGYSETLDAQVSNVTSYGDVLRSTVLLNLYRNDDVTWLVDEKALPVLRGNPYIKRILIYNLDSALQLQAERFDTVINLEKVPGLCALTDSVKAWRRYGFRFDANTGDAESYDGSHVVLALCRNLEHKRNRKICWQEGLFEMVGAQWKDEEYVLGYKPKGKVKADIGFNYLVGNKWPLKGWPMPYWKRLKKAIGKKYKVSWQQGKEDVEAYFEWINSCRMIVTNDSFGMHIAIALKKPFVAIFGPTPYHENFLYGRGVACYPKDLDCEFFPCRKDICPHFKDGCTTRVKPEEVLGQIKRLLA